MVLDGARKIIEMYKPTIFVEIWDVNLGVYHMKKEDVFERLDDMGYTWKKLIDAEHIIDYVAIPK